MPPASGLCVSVCVTRNIYQEANPARTTEQWCYCSTISCWTWSFCGEGCLWSALKCVLARGSRHLHKQIALSHHILTSLAPQIQVSAVCVDATACLAITSTTHTDSYAEKHTVVLASPHNQNHTVKMCKDPHLITQNTVAVLSVVLGHPVNCLLLVGP